MNRRRFSVSLLQTVASYALMRTLFTQRAFAGAVRPVTDGWLRELHELCLDLRTGTIAPAAWQERIARLHDRIELADLLRYIDFERLIEGFRHPDLGVHTKPVRFPRLAGLPDRLAFHGKLFGMQRDRAIIPHGHRNMASCHYVLQGELWLRQYDKVAEDATHMELRPTIDEAARPGTHSSISDERDNVHWLRATTDTAFTFDVIVLDLGGRRWEVDNIDPYGAERIEGGLLRARKLPVDEALRKYGHDTHHRR